MSTVMWVLLVVVALVIFVLMRGVKPEQRTDGQLWALYNQALKAGPLGTQDLAKIESEMKKRGLLQDRSAEIIETEQPSVEAMVEYTRKSGLTKAMQEFFASGAPESMLKKTLEIASKKGITAEEASVYFNELFEARANNYRNAGLQADDADRKALEEVQIWK